MFNRFGRRRLGGVLAIATLWGVGELRAQTLETETARIVPRHGIKFGYNFEHQRSAEGQETAMPFIVEFGFDGKTELVVEPIPYTAIRPKVGPRATGPGDVEVTLVRLVTTETRSRPAFAIAGEVKIPTARNVLIGTGKADFAAYLIGSKRFGRLDAHLNLGYTFVGQPAGIRLSNIANVAAGFMYDLGGRTRMFGEVLANTAATAGAPEGSATPEVAGGEVVGTIGVGRLIAHRLFTTMAISYDNNGAVLVRPGFMLTIK